MVPSDPKCTGLRERSAQYEAHYLDTNGALCAASVMKSLIPVLGTRTAAEVFGSVNKVQSLYISVLERAVPCVVFGCTPACVPITDSTEGLMADLC